jgi:ABC-type hemin transport system ATPase subunit
MPITRTASPSWWQGNIKAMGKPKEVLQPELIAEAYCLLVQVTQVVQHPFLDVPLVLLQIE